MKYTILLYPSIIHYMLIALSYYTDSFYLKVIVLLALSLPLMIIVRDETPLGKILIRFALYSAMSLGIVEILNFFDSFHPQTIYDFQSILLRLVVYGSIYFFVLLTYFILGRVAFSWLKKRPVA